MSYCLDCAEKDKKLREQRDEIALHTKRIKQLEHGYDILRTALHKAEAERDAAMKDAERYRAELCNIAAADPSDWEADVRDQFQEWAQSRARAAMKAKP